MLGINIAAEILNLTIICLLGAHGIGANRRIKKLTEYLNHVQHCLDTSRELFNNSLAREETLRDLLNNSLDEISRLNKHISHQDRIIAALKITLNSRF